MFSQACFCYMICNFNDICGKPNYNVMDLKEYYNSKVTGDFYEFYSVPDRIENTDEMIFILESGHDEEVNSKYPLAGKSGKNFSKFILGTDLAAGKLSKKNFPKIGFLESSSLPLDIETYRKFTGNIKAPQVCDFDLVKTLSNIKTQYATCSNLNEYIRFKDWLNVKLDETKLYEDYEKRLKLLWNKEKYFVICGFIAQAFFEKYINIRGEAGYKTYFKSEKFVPIERNNVIYFKHPVKWTKNNCKNLKALIDEKLQTISD